MTADNTTPNAGFPVFRNKVTGDAFDRMQIDGAGQRYRSNGTVTPLKIPELCLNMADVLTLTSQPAADTFQKIIKTDTTGFSEIRFLGRIATVSASAGTPLLTVGFSTTFTVTPASLVTPSTGPVQFSMFTGATYGDSGWLPLLDAAKAESIFLAVKSIGGDASASPVVQGISIMLR